MVVFHSLIFCDACDEYGDTRRTDSWSLADGRSLHVDVRLLELELHWRLSMCRVYESHHDVMRRSARDRQGEQRRSDC
ncbi:hypothetical protein KUCAC02_005855 [Chaenocephalus aceratus]|uniref:Uncharacterized protein n=2 Tax=Chaenocephalus aceratus TaxID=36190 RepID=A0ACB9WQM7_CHAAC|nr:hypothetical protein KUCAC02_005849 [Chaenocephalus aceratus]KAI4815720.1 hypothetical protein KUCAC02_005855 [Chaenocephalus aceratus]